MEGSPIFHSDGFHYKYKKENSDISAVYLSLTI